MFLIYNLQTTYGVDMFIIELLSMFRMSSSSRSLITTVMRKLMIFFTMVAVQ
jgi:hypothetical protein